MKSSHGGARAGAGAKQGSRWTRTLEKAAAHALYREAVLTQMTPLVRAQIEAATGAYATVAVVELTEAGLKLRRVTDERELDALVSSGKGSRIALADPDLQMSRYLTDQVCGKATESLEISGPQGGPIEVHDHFAVAAPR